MTPASVLLRCVYEAYVAVDLVNAYSRDQQPRTVQPQIASVVKGIICSGGATRDSGPAFVWGGVCVRNKNFTVSLAWEVDACLVVAQVIVSMLLLVLAGAALE
eukprot:3839269-Amphidinium_carterae.1